MDKIKKNFGFGMMRLPMNGEEVNIEETKKMVDAFLNAGFPGIRLFSPAWATWSRWRTTSAL